MAVSTVSSNKEVHTLVSAANLYQRLRLKNTFKSRKRASLTNRLVASNDTRFRYLSIDSFTVLVLRFLVPVMGFGSLHGILVPLMGFLIPTNTWYSHPTIFSEICNMVYPNHIFTSSYCQHPPNPLPQTIPVIPPIPPSPRICIVVMTKRIGKALGDQDMFHVKVAGFLLLVWTLRPFGEALLKIFKTDPSTTEPRAFGRGLAPEEPRIAFNDSSFRLTVDQSRLHTRCNYRNCLLTCPSTSSRHEGLCYETGTTHWRVPTSYVFTTFSWECTCASWRQRDNRCSARLAESHSTEAVWMKDYPRCLSHIINAERPFYGMS